MLRKTVTDYQSSNLDTYQQSSSELFYVFIGIFFFFFVEKTISFTTDLIQSSKERNRTRVSFLPLTFCQKLLILSTGIF